MQERSCGSVRIFWLDCDLVINRIVEKIPLLDSDPDARELWLFGSLADKRAVPGSDCDLLLLLMQSDLRFVDRIMKYLEIFDDIGIGVDIFPYTPDELDSPIAMQALKSGKLLWKKSSFHP